MWYSHSLEFSNEKEQNYWYTHGIRCIRLSERSQTQKAIYCVIPFICHFCKGKSTRPENKSVVGWGGEEGVEQFGGYAIVLYLNCCGGYKTKHLWNSELHIKKNFYCTWITHQWAWLKRKKHWYISKTGFTLVLVY